MRTITIAFKEEGCSTISVLSDFGNDNQGTILENKLANAAHILIEIALKQLPANLIGEGHGDTMEEADFNMKIDKDIFNAGRSRT